MQVDSFLETPAGLRLIDRIHDINTNARLLDDAGFGVSKEGTSVHFLAARVSLREILARLDEAELLR